MSDELGAAAGRKHPEQDGTHEYHDNPDKLAEKLETADDGAGVGGLHRESAVAASRLRSCRAAILKLRRLRATGLQRHPGPRPLAFWPPGIAKTGSGRRPAVFVTSRPS